MCFTRGTSVKKKVKMIVYKCVIDSREKFYLKKLELMLGLHVLTHGCI